MITYTVKYRKIGSFIWRTIRNVKGDGYCERSADGVYFGPYRYFILADESTVDIPMNGLEFKMSKERHGLIKDQMSEEAGQNIRLRNE